VTVNDGDAFFNTSSVSDIATFTYSYPYGLGVTEEAMWFITVALSPGLTSLLRRHRRHRQLVFA
jgi:hypothetical protein